MAIEVFSQQNLFLIQGHHIFVLINHSFLKAKPIPTPLGECLPKKILKTIKIMIAAVLTFIIILIIDAIKL